MTDLVEDRERQDRSFRAFAEREVLPFSEEFDRAENVPADVLGKLAKAGYYGAVAPAEHGGQAWDPIECGMLAKELGRASLSVLSMLVVHGMVVQSVTRRGNDEQKAAWLPVLASGEKKAAFALTEPEVGSDAAAVRTDAKKTDDGFVLTGSKKWISGAQTADAFMVVARYNDKPCTLIVDRTTPGLSVAPMSGLMGFRGAMLGELTLDQCAVPASALVGPAELGFEYVVLPALNFGRYWLAWGCVGLMGDCVARSMAYAQNRRQFGKPLKDHELISRLLSRMIVTCRAAEALCAETGRMLARNDSGAMVQAMCAKYFAARGAREVSGDAIQVHGANGCTDEMPLQRHFRDAKIMEIIEGTNEIHELVIAEHGSIA
jgi:alkylation response protein AidB-like acyl-CoA dehydrogenase